MPRPRPLDQSSAEKIGAELNLETAMQVGELAVLLRRVGVIIRARNANGKFSAKFCKLCSTARLLKMPCPHEEIWRLGK